MGLEAVPIQARLLFIGILFLGTLAISRFSIRVGIPAILGVLLMGLFININYIDLDPHQAENLHVFSLALLLFYAGLKTDIKAIRGFLEYGLILAVGGVIVSSGALGLLIYWLASANGADLAPGLSNSMPLAAALLIAACLGSTDAGATLSVLSQLRHRVPERVRHLLEFESALNDPAALLVYGLILGVFAITGLEVPAVNQALHEQALHETVLAGLRHFLQQIGSGLILGAAFGYVAKFVIDFLVHEKAQLLVVAMSIAFVDYGCADALGGSGFVAVYVTGVFMTNMAYRMADVNHESIQEVLLPFNTMTEITIFLSFGLLVSPNDLLPSLPMGLVSALGLMLVARPLSVLVFQPFSPFSWREALLISWCGLRGAVPLALSYNVVTAIPRIRGLDAATAEMLAQNAKSIIFVVVVLNLLVQGLTLPWLARALNLEPKDGAAVGASLAGPTG
jgi:cell volume regulation protein A